MASITLIAALVFPLLIHTVTTACVPDVPQRLLSDPAIAKHPAVVSAIQIVEESLNQLKNQSQDGFSFAIVHASSPEKVFVLNHGVLKVNETSSDAKDNVVTSDSIFRVMSISKNFAALSALVVENLCGSEDGPIPAFTLDTPVRTVLPQFKLPEKDWKDGGRDITLRMLASHSSGLPREAYSTDFHMIAGTGKADAATIGADWAAVTPEGVLEYVKKTNLMFAPGQRAAYSNAGVAILGNAVAAQYNKIKSSKSTWSQLVTEEILSPLNMTHSFFGPVPDKLRPSLGIPGGENWADLVIKEGYDPVAGLWSSPNDIAKYLYNVWLRPDSSLITAPQRRLSLKPNSALPDGKQLAGAGWEIDLFNILTSNESTALNKTYASYGKAGDGGGWHAWFDNVPSLGYGVILMSQQSGSLEYPSIYPVDVKNAAQEVLVPAFSEAVAARMGERFAGIYTHGKDGGEISDELKRNETNSTSYAKLELDEQILYLRELVVNGTSALEGLDRLSWTPDAQPIVFSSPLGAPLTPAEGAGENSQFGTGTQAWRFMIPGLEVCDWFDFDGYKDQNGWSLSKIVLVESEGGVELHYPPYDIVLTRSNA